MNRLLYFIIALILIFGIMSCNGSKNKERISSIPQELAKLNEQIEKNPKNSDFLYQRSQYYYKKEKYSEALSDINKALEFNKKTDYYLLLSDVYLMTGKIKEAKSLLLKTSDNYPDKIDPILKLARLHLVVKDYNQAFVYLSKAHQMDKNNADAFFLQGLACLETGDTNKALNNYQLAVDRNQNHFEAYMQLADLNSLKGNKIALAYYDNALRINHQSKDALYARALFCQNNDMADNAIDTYQRLIVIDPNFKYAYYNIGYIYLVYIKDFKKAEDYFTKAINCDKNYYEAWYNRGYSYELAGDFVNARKDYQKTLKIEVNYPKAIDGMNRLDDASTKR